MAAEGFKRKLTAIVSADVVGWSRLMGEDEAGTLATLKRYREELIDPKIEEYGGRIVSTAGDSVLVEYPSAVDAVRCSVELQEAIAERNAELPEESRMLFRIGVNLGEVIADGDDIFGDGVNIAARLQAIAGPGYVCVSGKVRDEVGKKLDMAFDDLGEQTVKNIARPVRVYTVSAVRGETDTAGIEAGGLPLPSKPSIAVLPFNNMSGDSEQEYFADGIAEDIITGLSRYHDLFVISRNSSFTYKRRAVSVKQVGTELGVRYVLEGSVRKGGNRVRVSVQLIDAATDTHIWAERYEGTLEDIFDFQDRIAVQAVGAISSSIVSAGIETARRKHPDSLDAYDLRLRGVACTQESTPASFNEAKKAFRKALEIDPLYASAYAELANVYCLGSIYGWAKNPETSLEEADRMSRRAVSLDAHNAWAHAVLSCCLLFRRQFELARAEAERALELNPNFAEGLLFRALVSAFCGKPDDGIEDAKRAIRLSPRDPLMWGFEDALAFSQYQARDYAAAVETASKTVVRFPNFPFGHLDLAVAYGQLGETTRAKAALADALRLAPDLVAVVEGQPFEDPRDREHLIDGLRKAGWEG
jgi:adenylate cyclase